jgi:endonuclease/exonuclease/phosphatase family metal-dependent hydrolase
MVARRAASGSTRAMRVLSLLLFALLFAAPAGADTLKLATWNLEWLTLRPAGDPALPADVTPRQDGDFALLAGYAAKLAADVVAFQEVDGPQAAARVFPPDRYRIVVTHDPVVQRVGLAIRRDIAFTQNPDVTALDPYPDARLPLRSGADVTLQLGGSRLRLLAVHLKTGCFDGPLARSRKPACATLRQQVPALAGWIAQRQAEGVPYVVLGDFNRHFGDGDPVSAALLQSAPLTIADAGVSSPCWGGERFIDHILAGGAARAWLQPDSLRVLVYRQTGPEWKQRLSDHCPVSVTFDIPG